MESRIRFERVGTGEPLLLVHGLGANRRSWGPVVDRLAADRELILLDLPGFGLTPALLGRPTFAGLADAVEKFLAGEQLLGVDAVGHSMGGRLVLELARRRGVLGGTVALNPGGFWSGWQRHYVFLSLWLSVRMARAARKWLPALAANPWSRSLLLAQLSARPWEVDADDALQELRSFADASSFDPLLTDLIYGPQQQGASAGQIEPPLVIAWGRQDRLLFPGQAGRAKALFPDAQLHWLSHCGHYAQWDQTVEVAHLILSGTRGHARATTVSPRGERRPVEPGLLVPGQTQS